MTLHRDIMSSWDAQCADMVGLAIEKALLKIGMPMHDKVHGMLQGRCATFSDCYRHPDMLNSILKSVFGDGYISVIKQIQKELRKYYEYPKVVEFLKVIKEE